MLRTETGLTQENGQESNTLTLNGNASHLELPDAAYVTDAQMTQDGYDLVLSVDGGQTVVVEGYFLSELSPTLQAPNGKVLTPQLVNSFIGTEQQFASIGGENDASPIGAIQEISGDANVTRVDGSVEQVQIGMPIFQGDIVETEATGAVNIVFVDETSFAISEDSRLSIDEYVFDPATSEGTTDFSVLKGMFVFTSGMIGREDPDDVNIDTPMGSIGIRGTIIAADVDDGEVTVVEGAIVLRDPLGNEVTLSNQFETAKFDVEHGQINHMGELSANDVATKFSSISNVSPNLFSSIQDAANDGDSEASGDEGNEAAEDGVEQLDLDDAEGSAETTEDNLDNVDGVQEYTPLSEEGEQQDLDSSEESEGEGEGDAEGADTMEMNDASEESDVKTAEQADTEDTSADGSESRADVQSQQAEAQSAQAQKAEAQQAQAQQAEMQQAQQAESQSKAVEAKGTAVAEAKATAAQGKAAANAPVDNGTESTVAVATTATTAEPPPSVINTTQFDDNTSDKTQNVQQETTETVVEETTTSSTFEVLVTTTDIVESDAGSVVGQITGQNGTFSSISLVGPSAEYYELIASETDTNTYIVKLQDGVLYDSATPDFTIQATSDDGGVVESTSTVSAYTAEGYPIFLDQVSDLEFTVGETQTFTHGFGGDFVDPDGGMASFLSFEYEFDFSDSSMSASDIESASMDTTGILTFTVSGTSENTDFDIIVTVTDTDGKATQKTFVMNVLDGTVTNPTDVSDSSSGDTILISNGETVTDFSINDDANTVIFSSGNDSASISSDDNIVHMGAGDDILTIESGARDNEVTGGEGNDTFNINAGQNKVYGENGQDVFNANFSNETAFDISDDFLIDGGANAENNGDIMSFQNSSSSGMTIDFTILDDNNIQNIETLSFVNSADDTVILSLTDVISMTDDNNTLVIYGDNGDTLSFQNEGINFAETGTGTDMEFGDYTEYTGTNGSGDTVTLIIGDDISTSGLTGTVT